MSEVQKLIDSYYTSHYKYIYECAFNSLKKIRRTDLKADLVSECYLYLLRNLDKIAPLVMKGGLESIIVSYMDKQVTWSNTVFKKRFLNEDRNIDLNIDTSEAFDLPLFADEDEEILKAEFEIQDKINHIYSTLPTLPLAQRLLFDDMINKGIKTSGKLVKHTGLPRTECTKQINNLKFYLTSGYTSSHL